MSNRTDGYKIKIVADNRKASFLYEIIEKYEAGISLYGPEIKSIKSGEGKSFRRVCRYKKRRGASVKCPYKSIRKSRQRK